MPGNLFLGSMFTSFFAGFSAVLSDQAEALEAVLRFLLEVTGMFDERP
jgi:hypothetical protein